MLPTVNLRERQSRGTGEGRTQGESEGLEYIIIKKWQFYKAVILLWDFKLVKVCKAHLGGSHPFDNEILKKRTLSELLGKT